VVGPFVGRGGRGLCLQWGVRGGGYGGGWGVGPGIRGPCGVAWRRGGSFWRVGLGGRGGGDGGRGGEGGGGRGGGVGRGGGGVGGGAQGGGRGAVGGGGGLGFSVWVGAGGVCHHEARSIQKKTAGQETSSQQFS